MDQRAARTQIAAALKAAGFKPRRGRMRLQVGDLWWYLDVLADGPSPSAQLRLEVGCWPPAVRSAEPEGGAVDCPLLTECDLGDDPRAEVAAVCHTLAAIGDLSTLAGALGGDLFARALLDHDLRAAFDPRA